MPKVTFIEHDGTRHTVEATPGLHLMRVALDNGVPGIDADCGGECACATCHIIVEDDWSAAVGPAHETESAMLDLNMSREANSRLACQVQMTDELDGLVARLPEFQY